MAQSGPFSQSGATQPSLRTLLQTYMNTYRHTHIPHVSHLAGTLEFGPFPPRNFVVPASWLLLNPLISGLILLEILTAANCFQLY